MVTPSTEMLLAPTTEQLDAIRGEVARRRKGAEVVD